MLLEVKKLSYIAPEDIWNQNNYESDGIYIVSFGTETMEHLVLVDNGIVSTICAPNGISTKYQPCLGKTEIIDSSEIGRIEKLCTPLYTEEKIDGYTLLRAIAIAQKPELAIDLLK